MDEKKHSTQSQAEKESQKGSPASGKSNVPGVANRTVFSKRWLYPAIYLGAAAVIIGLMYVKSQVGTAPTSGSIANAPTQAGNVSQAESFLWPVAQGTTPKVTLGAFPVHGSQAAQAKALVKYDHGYQPHMGVDIKSDSGNGFQVTAALAGKVTEVQKNPLQGLSVQVTSANGYVCDYESLGSENVKVGDTVAQGQTLGVSGTDLYEQSQGNHLFFEVLKNGTMVDPVTVLPKN